MIAMNDDFRPGWPEEPDDELPTLCVTDFAEERAPKLAPHLGRQLDSWAARQDASRQPVRSEGRPGVAITPEELRRLHVTALGMLR